MNIKPKKIIVFAFTAFYLPGYRGGGPIRTVSNIIQRLGDEFHFKVATFDRDLGSSDVYLGVISNSWKLVGKADVFYVEKSFKTLFYLLKVLRRESHDVLYLNSFFDPVFTFFPLFLRKLHLIPFKPVILAARGEFSAGALSIKRWKKIPYIWILRKLNFLDEVTWHASNVMESDDIRRHFYRSCDFVNIAPNISVASDLPSSSNIASSSIDCSPVVSCVDNVLRLSFLSRVAVMKNLSFALEVLSFMRCPIEFNIYGPIEDDVYWLECQDLIKNLPCNIVVRYVGPVDHRDVFDVLAASDLLFVPSLGENFGHVFLESLSAGTPILVSDRTPWRDLVDKGIGWDISLDNTKDFVSALNEFSVLSVKDKQVMRRRCFEYADAIFSDQGVIEANRSLFAGALNRFN